jgi:DNA-binding CsgD family transcriptional regulator
VTALITEQHVTHPFTLRSVGDPEQQETVRRLTCALADMAHLTTVDQLVEHAPAALCRVGFDRAMISRVESSRWVVERFHSVVDPRGAELITQAARSEPQQLTPSVIEMEMIRRRVPLLVSDVDSEPRVHRQLAEMTRSTSYVAAPVMPEKDVIGFLHADRIGDVGVDALDREVVSLFAQQFSQLVHTAWLLERFDRLRETVDHLTSSLGGMISGCTAGSIDLAPALVVVPGLPAQQSAAGHLSASLLEGAPEFDALLSAREREVLSLMALGDTNTKIASRLVISEGTVKSHVRHILRKLNASNRAEAVCRWLQRPATR